MAREATLHDTPEGNVSQPIELGAEFMATGRTADGQWIYGRMSSGAVGWMHVNHITIFNEEYLRVMEESLNPALEPDEAVPSSVELWLQTLRLLSLAVKPQRRRCR